MPPYLLRKLAQLFLSSLLIALLGITVMASSPAWKVVCPTDAIYTANSPFHTNLNLLLSSLSSNAPPTRFFKDTKGQSPDQVYGLALCEDDNSPDDCRRCLATAINDTIQHCPQGKRYAVWYPLCFLRYSNESFFSSTDTSPVGYLWDNGNIASDPTSFDQLLGHLMSGVPIGPPHVCGRTGGLHELSEVVRDGVVYEGLVRHEALVVIEWSCYLRFEMYLVYNSSYNADQPVGVPPSLSASSSPATRNISASPPESTSTTASNDYPLMLSGLVHTGKRS